MPVGSPVRTGRWPRRRSWPAASRRPRACRRRVRRPRAGRAGGSGCRCARRRSRRDRASVAASGKPCSAPRRSTASFVLAGVDDETPTTRAPARRAAVGVHGTDETGTDDPDAQRSVLHPRQPQPCSPTPVILPATSVDCQAKDWLDDRRNSVTLEPLTATSCAGSLVARERGLQRGASDERVCRHRGDDPRAGAHRSPRRGRPGGTDRASPARRSPSAPTRCWPAACSSPEATVRPRADDRRRCWRSTAAPAWSWPATSGHPLAGRSTDLAGSVLAQHRRTSPWPRARVRSSRGSKVRSTPCSRSPARTGSSCGASASACRGRSSSPPAVP